MTSYENHPKDGSLTLERIVTWGVMGLLALAALKLLFWVLGLVFGLGVFLLFTVAPLLLVGWLALKVYEAFRGQPRGSDSFGEP